MNDVPLNCPACSTPLDEFVCPHCEDGQDEEGNQCAECCGTNWLHIRQELGKESSLGDEHACGECGHIECRSAHETSSPRWKRADKLWSEYPIGTVARQSWTGCKWTKNERGWKAHAGDTFPIPGGADEVAVSEQGEPTADETNGAHASCSLCGGTKRIASTDHKGVDCPLCKL